MMGTMYCLISRIHDDEWIMLCDTALKEAEPHEYNMGGVHAI